MTRDIAEILHISHMGVIRHLKTFGRRVHKSLRCLGASQFDGKEFNGPYFHAILCSNATKMIQTNNHGR